MARLLVVPGVLVLLVAAGCGSSAYNAATTTTTTAVGALQAEATATAAGDIPDNQVFLVYRNSVARYSMKYPEGWAQRAAGGNVTFRDKNNIVRIVVAPGAAPTKASVQ